MLKNLQAKLKDQKGFSLVELIVVIAIMVILIAMLVPNVVGYINKATIATEKSAAATIFTAAQTYVTDYYSEHRAVVTPTVADLVGQSLLAPDTTNKANVAAATITVDASQPIVTKVEFASSVTGQDSISYTTN